MKKLILLFAILAMGVAQGQTEVYDYGNRAINGTSATIWDSGYQGKIYVNDTLIKITPSNSKANSWVYNVLKHKSTNVGGEGKNGYNVDTFTLDRRDEVLDEDLRIKGVLTIFNKPVNLGRRVNRLQIIVRDAFTETNHTVTYYIKK